jgi:hypothetical protein
VVGSCVSSASGAGRFGGVDGAAATTTVWTKNERCDGARWVNRLTLVSVRRPGCWLCRMGAVLRRARACANETTDSFSSLRRRVERETEKRPKSPLGRALKRQKLEGRLSAENVGRVRVCVRRGWNEEAIGDGDGFWGERNEAGSGGAVGGSGDDEAEERRPTAAPLPSPFSLFCVLKPTTPISPPQRAPAAVLLLLSHT